MKFTATGPPRAGPAPTFHTLSKDGDPAVGDDHLPGDERGRLRGEEHRDAADVARHAEAPQRRHGNAALAARVVFPQPRVFVPEGKEPDNKFNRYTAAPVTLLWRIIDEALSDEWLDNGGK